MLRLKTMIPSLILQLFAIFNFAEAASTSIKQPVIVDENNSPTISCLSHADCLSSEKCERINNHEMGVCVMQKDVDQISSDELNEAIGATVLTGGALNVESLTINPPPGKDAKVSIGTGDTQFSLKKNVDNSFGIFSGENPMFTIDTGGNIMAMGKLHTKGALQVWGKLEYQGLSQFFIASAESFTKTAHPDWTNATVTSCGGKRMLGGYGKFAGGEVTRVYDSKKASSGFKAGPHKELRLKANFHFIDSWEGDSAYAKIDHMYVWSDVFDAQATVKGFSICGTAAAETKFTVPIDVAVPHNGSSVAITFGSTLSKSPSEASWGISDVYLYVR